MGQRKNTKTNQITGEAARRRQGYLRHRDVIHFVEINCFLMYLKFILLIDIIDDMKYKGNLVQYTIDISYLRGIWKTSIYRGAIC